MQRHWWCPFLALAIVLGGVAGASAQVAASISGIVRDSAGGVVPGVTVVVKEDNTGQTFEVITSTMGRYEVLALQAGSYTVSASLTGFKTAEAKSIRVAPGQPVTVPLTLEVGQISETVIVASSTELINTQTAAVASTLNSDQLTRMPTPTRNALNAITFLPGVNTPGTNRDSTINGLPESFLSITLDGVSNNDNFLRSTDSFFAMVTPRQDAVEAVSVTLAAAGAQVGGGLGAVTMAFQTRSGGNRFTGSAYEYYRNPRMNTPYYFNKVNNLPINQVELNQFGARVGGPITIPGLYDGRNKAFFFFHYEQIRYPNSFTRTRTVFNPRVYDGWFRYQYGSEVREVNLLTLAAQNGQIAAIDPTMKKIMSMIDAATKTMGTRSAGNDPLYDSYVWNSECNLFEQQPTVRLDYNVTSKHRLSGSFAMVDTNRTPDYLNSADPRFPGAPNMRDYKSRRPLFSISMRSVLSPTIINEARGGMQFLWGASYFGRPASQDSRNGPKTFEDQGGFAITTPTSTTDWYTSNTPSWRTSPTYSFEDTVTWQRRAHTMTMGGSVLVTTAESDGQQMVPGITLGFDTQYDPAIGIFNTTNFPGASTANLDAARATYAVLTGRVASVNSRAVLDGATGKYVELAPQVLPGGIKVFGVFFQDSWRPTPTLTLTGGFRYDVQMPFAPSSSVMSSVTMASVCGMSSMGDGGLYSKCKFLSPGASGGAVPEFIQLKKGTEGYKVDWNDVAPSGSVAWRPNVQSGFLRKLFGDPDQATVRAGFAVAYAREGLTTFTSLYGNNQGLIKTLTRNVNLGLVPAGESWPVLLSQKSRLYTASFDPEPHYPIAIRANRADRLDAFAPDIQIARVRNWMIGFARSISKDTAVEIRYVGNKGDNQWSSLNYNSIRVENLVANGFLNEFKLAMANLAANNASGSSTRSGSFAYFGPGTGTNPLPIYLAYLQGNRDYTNAAVYTNTTSYFKSSSLAGRLVGPNPNPTSAASDLDGSASRRAQAESLGYPRNFFVPNPDASSVNVTDSGAFSDYHALQIELRRRMSRGLSAGVNYQFAVEGGSAFDGFTFGRVMTPTANVRHAVKLQWDWILPFGRGERFGSNMNAILNAIAGGWSVNGVGRMQRVLQDLGNVKLVGITRDELQKMYKFYIRPNATTGLDEVWMLPEDVVLNTRRAFSTATATLDGYSTSLGPPEGQYIAPANSATCIQIREGDCAPRSTMLLAPWFVRFDVGATKRFQLPGRMNIEIRMDVLNVLDKPNFYPVASPGSGASIFRTTTAYQDASNTYDPGGRIGQFMVRFNW